MTVLRKIPRCYSGLQSEYCNSVMTGAGEKLATYYSVLQAYCLQITGNVLQLYLVPMRPHLESYLSLEHCTSETHEQTKKSIEERIKNDERSRRHEIKGKDERTGIIRFGDKKTEREFDKSSNIKWLAIKFSMSTKGDGTRSNELKLPEGIYSRY